VYYSKKFEGGPINDCFFLKINVDPAGGDIKALAHFVDKLIIFKANRIYAADGEGYDNAGGGANFNTWLVNPSIGCRDQRCLALTPMGLVFMATDGNVWLMNNSLQCEIFSDPVRHYLAESTPNPCAIVTSPDRSLIHVFTGNQGTLVYDWTAKKWSVWNGRTTTAINGALQATEINGITCWLDSDNYFWGESATVWTDYGTHYGLAVDTGWLHGGGLTGMQRMYWLLITGQNIASHTLRVQIAYDMDPTWLDDNTYDASALTPFDYASHFGSGLAATYEGQAYVLRVFTTRPTCSSIRVRVSDSVGDNNGWSLTAVSLVVGAKPGKGMRVHKARVI
jgi:hypothetical protein